MISEIKKHIAQIRRGEVPEGYKKTKVAIIPQAWKETQLKKMFIRQNRKNTVNNTNVLTISAQYGLINQEEFFNKPIASEDKSNYFLLEQGDFAYNKSYSNGYPFGAIKPLKRYEKGIVSPLYICFSPSKDNLCPEYFEHYFESGLLNHEIQAIAQEGVRNHGLLNIAVGDFFNSFLIAPPFSEQQCIATILTTQDKLIELKEKLLEEKKQQKKYLMQQLLTGKKRLPGFSGEWKMIRLNQILTERTDKNQEQKLRICSVAVREGVVDQIEHLGRSFAAKDTSNYGVAYNGDVIYTKSPTGDFPFGIIKQSHLRETVAVSPLYGIYKPVSYGLGYILHTYFSDPINAKNYLFPIVQKGAKNTINITNKVFVSNSLYLPMDISEQNAIAEVFMTADREIDLLQQSIDAEKQKKKALMQLLLTGIVRVKI